MSALTVHAEVADISTFDFTDYINESILEVHFISCLWGAISSIKSSVPSDSCISLQIYEFVKGSWMCRPALYSHIQRQITRPELADINCQC